MLGLVGLKDGPSRSVATPGPADRLDQELVRPLRGTLVGQVEGDVGRHDADQRDRRDVEALGHEARPDEDIETPGAEGIDHPLRRAAMLDDVAVEAADAQPGNVSRTSRSTRSVPPPR